MKGTNMKRIIELILCVYMLLPMMVACDFFSDKNDVAGIWEDDNDTVEFVKNSGYYESGYYWSASGAYSVDKESNELTINNIKSDGGSEELKFI